MLAHELRNPLAAISNAVTPQDASDLENINWAKEVIDRQVEHLARLIDDLLDVSRITRGKIRLQGSSSMPARSSTHAVESVRPAHRRGKAHPDHRVPSRASSGSTPTRRGSSRSS